MIFWQEKDKKQNTPAAYYGTAGNHTQVSPLDFYTKVYTQD